MSALTVPALAQWPASARWGYMQILLQALRATPGLDGVPVVHNPTGPSAFQGRPLALVLRDRTDAVQAAPGQAKQREHAFVLAAVAMHGAVAHPVSGLEPVTVDGLADRLHEAAVAVLHAALPALTAAAPPGRGVHLAEQNTTFQVEGFELDGALVVSNWLLKYQVAPRRAAP